MIADLPRNENRNSKLGSRLWNKVDPKEVLRYE